MMYVIAHPGPPPNSALARTNRIGDALAKLAYLILCAFVAIVPWGEAFNGLVLATWIGVLAFGIAAMRTIVTRQSRRPSPLHYWMLAFVAWIALSFFWTVDRDATLARILTFVQLVTLVWLIWELATTPRLIQGLLQSYVLGAFIASLMTIYNFLIGRTAAQLAAAEGVEKWETSRYSVSGVNENDLGLILALSMPMLLYLLVRARSPLVRLLCWLQLVAGMTATLLSASRGAVAATIVGLMMFPWTFARLPRLYRFVALSACAALLACAVSLVPETSWTRIAAFTSEVSQGTLTHRTMLWAAGLGMFRDHPFLGVGAGAYGPSILKIVDIPLVAHNTFLSVLVELGVCGALLLASLLAGIFYCAFRMRQLERCFWITLMLTWTIGVSALTWEYRKPTWLLFGLVAAHAFSRRAEEYSIGRPVPGLACQVTPPPPQFIQTGLRESA